MLKEKGGKGRAVDADEIDVAVEKIDNEKKEQGIVELQVTTTRWADDQTEVLNKDPRLHYIFALKDNMIEMAQCNKRSYEPAVGNEVIFGMKHPTPGKPKILFKTRILMCCPQVKVDARNQAMLSELEARRRSGNLDKANELQAQAGPTIGVSVFDGTQK